MIFITVFFSICHRFSAPSRGNLALSKMIVPKKKLGYETTTYLRGFGFHQYITPLGHCVFSTARVNTELYASKFFLLVYMLT